MIQAYSQNITVGASQPIPFNTVSIVKGCTTTQSGPSAFALNKCGIYEVSVNASAAASDTIQLYKDGTAVPEAISTGTAPGFVTLVQVDRNNNPCCACSSPVTLQVILEDAATLTNANIVITKLV